MKTNNISRALDEVWEWKDAIYREVKHLPAEKALRKIMENAARTAKEVGFNTLRKKRPLVIAESRAEYKVSSSDKRAGKGLLQEDALLQVRRDLHQRPTAE